MLDGGLPRWRELGAVAEGSGLGVGLGLGSARRPFTCVVGCWDAISLSQASLWNMQLLFQDNTIPYSA